MNRRDLLKLSVSAAVPGLPGAKAAQVNRYMDPCGRFFQIARRRTASVYDSTEVGFRELNSRVPASFACQPAPNA